MTNSLQAASPALRGAAWMIVGAFAFTIMGALVRVLSSELPVATIVLFRAAFSLPVLVAWMALRGRTGRLRTRHVWRHLARATCGAASLAFLIIAYRRLDFALATALAYTTPFWVILISIVFLAERPGWRRSLATAIGFVGVLVIVRPLPLLDLGIWAALASAAFGAGALTLLRRLSGLEPTETLLFYFFVFGIALSIVPAALAGVLPDPAQIAILAAVSAAGMLGLACAAEGYRLADATIIAPFDFLRLPMAGAIGYLFFAEIPQVWLLAGSLIMIASLYFVIAAQAPTARPARRAQ